MSTNITSFKRDSEVSFLALRNSKHLIIQEREVSYRFYPYFHPYVGNLTQRLLTGSTLGLQSADTEYLPNNVTLPGSVEIALASNFNLNIPVNSQIQLLSELQATLSGGGNIPLLANMKFRIKSAVQAKLPNGMQATLFDGMTFEGISRPSIGSDIRLPQDMKASIADTKITLLSATQIELYDGKQATIPANTEVLLLRGTQLLLTQNTSATLLKSKPRPVLYKDIFSAYTPSELVQIPYPVKDLDFTSGGAYSIYNWELFFHVPLTIAIHLSKNQHFAESQHWFHYLFDPTDDSEGPTPERFWKVRPFQTTDVKKLEEILVNLSTEADPVLRDDTVNSIKAWQDAPFRPHVIASYRQQSYMYKTVMAYLDNLIAWGDSLFRQDTGEAIDEAMMLYVLAANILGPRPQAVPKKGSVRPQTYNDLRTDLKQFGVVMRDVEAAMGLDLLPSASDKDGSNEHLSTLRSLGKALYFCVPRNDKLLSYWDTVADRLFKIRNSLNFQGIFRQLALFEPPIDPAMLARAAAAGLDVGAIVNGLNQPLPLVRFQLLVQKAAEICQEVKTLGNNLLSAMEKEEGEALAILRAKHEGIILEMVEHVKYSQLQEAIKSKEGLLKSLALAVQRYTYYELQLGKKAEDIGKSIPELDKFDMDSLYKMGFAAQEPEIAKREINVDIAKDLSAQVAQALNGGKIISSHEAKELLLLEAAQISIDTANVLNASSSIAHAIPTFKAQAQPMGGGATVEYGGKDQGWAIGALATGFHAIGDRLNFEARRANRVDSFTRREQDWAFQSNLAVGEINQIFKQVRAAEIRVAIADLELKNHRQQMKHANEIERFLNEEGTEKKGKKTNQAFYAWMKREVRGLYSQCFQFAFDIAKKAERALQHELGNPELSYLQYGYLAGKEGLLAGEKLYLDIKRMEMAYHDLNQREYELTKHISLLQVNPLALIQLRTTGRCVVQLPETLFDMDGPGHYFRRIKSVAVSIPCVTGPYASVNCTLTLLKSSIRKTQILRNGSYVREDTEDDRFNDYFGSVQSIVTSSAQNDSGLFETNLRDERYLPFENSGVVSDWQLELPANPSKKGACQFDYDTISDVILHFRYTAREGGGLLRKKAIEALPLDGSHLISLKHEYPNEWYQLLNSTTGVKFALKQEQFPFYWHSKTITVTDATLYLKLKDGTDYKDKDLTVSLNTLKGKSFGSSGNPISNISFEKISTPIPGTWTLKLDGVSKYAEAIEDIWVVMTANAENKNK